MLRLPGGTVAPHCVPCRQMSPRWFGLIPSRVCWNFGAGVSPFVVTDMNGYHCLSGVCLLGCSRLSVPSQKKASFPAWPAVIHTMVLVAVCGPVSTRMGFDQTL